MSEGKKIVHLQSGLFAVVYPNGSEKLCGTREEAEAVAAGSEETPYDDMYPDVPPWGWSPTDAARLALAQAREKGVG